MARILSNSYPITYIGDTLDRAAWARGQPETIKALGSDPKAQYWIVAQYAHPFTEGPMAKTLNEPEARAWIAANHPVYFLGLIGKQPQFALDLSALTQDQRASAFPECEWLDLRAIGSLLNTTTANLLALARGLSFWHQSTAFCSYCGSPTDVERGGFERICTNPDCRKLHYPRSDPVVIMLVTDERPGITPRCLLGRSTRLPEGVFSTLAGYVEPGESLEQAVSREVFEEAGIQTTDCQYRASQPWPFPCSLMLGFRARAISFDITLDDDEMLEAQWFTREDLKSFGEWGDKNATFKFPRPDSIARALIEDWLSEG